MSDFYCVSLLYIDGNPGYIEPNNSCKVSLADLITAKLMKLLEKIGRRLKDQTQCGFTARSHVKHILRMFWTDCIRSYTGVV